MQVRKIVLLLPSSLLCNRLVYEHILKAFRIFKTPKHRLLLSVIIRRARQLAVTDLKATNRAYIINIKNDKTS